MRTAMLALVTACALSALIMPAGAATYVIAPDGSEDFPDIASCVAVCGDGDIIELTDGTFTGPGNTNVFITGIVITIRSQSGSSTNCRIDCNGQPGTTTRAFLIEDTPSWGFTIQDIAIENGYCTQDWGGGILISNSASVSLNNVAFRANYASWGGAICLGPGTIYVAASECRFLDNIAETGGGAVYAHSGESLWTGCRFIANTTSVDGGACHCDAGGEMDFYMSTFSRNLAGLGGGALYYRGVTDLDMGSCTFSGNSCVGDAAINIGPDPSVDIDNTLIVFTTDGLGLDCRAPVVDIDNTNIYGNGDGDWTGSIAGFLGSGHNISLDPQFCSDVPDDHQNWTLQEDSPCTALNSLAGIQIGAFGKACGLTPAQQTNWGVLKHKFRR
ncbi:MAG: hypothetical protein KAY32_12680 [Candidatus Eisenbacteria sp.]|nr:hypothetical protein [Candidatus Eisenbacteria bacterium]